MVRKEVFYQNLSQQGCLELWFSYHNNESNFPKHGWFVSSMPLTWNCLCPCEYLTFDKSWKHYAHTHTSHTTYSVPWYFSFFFSLFLQCPSTFLLILFVTVFNHDIKWGGMDHDPVWDLNGIGETSKLLGCFAPLLWEISKPCWGIHTKAEVAPKRENQTFTCLLVLRNWFDLLGNAEHWRNSPECLNKLRLFQDPIVLSEKVHPEALWITVQPVCC